MAVFFRLSADYLFSETTPTTVSWTGVITLCFALVNMNLEEEFKPLQLSNLQQGTIFPEMCSKHGRDSALKHALIWETWRRFRLKSGPLTSERRPHAAKFEGEAS